MNKYIKKIICLLLMSALITMTVACTYNKEKVGSGEDGVVADIDWSSYDDLLLKIKGLGKSKERDIYIHETEEMLMDEACVIPVATICNKAVCRENLKNIYMDKSNLVHFDRMYYEDGKKIANIQLYAEPPSLDPGLAHYTSEHTFLSNMYNTIVAFDKDGELENVFLDHYEVSDDELTYKLYLKKNLKWSDGVPFTAKDLEYTLKRNAKTETGGPLSFVFNPIEGFPNNLNVKALDDVTLMVKLNNKCPYFLSLWLATGYIPLREDIVEKSSDWYMTVPNVTCGPYILKEWNHKESMVLEKNPYYFDADNIKLDRINLMLNGNSTAIYSAYYAGDIDFALTIPNSVNDDPDLVKYKTMGMQFLRFNTKSKMFEGFTRDEAKKLRKAISYCIDRNFIESMSYGRYEKAYTIVNDLFEDSEGKSFLRNTDVYKYPYENGYFEDINYDKARELLKEIGFHFDKNGKIIEDLTFEMMASVNEYDYMSIIQSDLAKIGINMKIRKRDDAFGNVGKYYAMHTGWYPDYYDPFAMLELFSTDNDNNTCFLGRELPKKQ